MIQKKSVLTSKAASGFSLLEIILASTIFALVVTALVGAIIYGRESTALAGTRARALFLAEEGLEALRSIRDDKFSKLNNGTRGLKAMEKKWALSGAEDATDVFTRRITISTAGPNRKQIVSTVTWQETPGREGSISLTTYLTNWKPF